MQFFIPLYFCFAVLYDIFTTAYAIAYKGARLPWENEPFNGIMYPVDPDIPVFINNSATTTANFSLQMNISSVSPTASLLTGLVETIAETTSSLFTTESLTDMQTVFENISTSGPFS